jgi:hypothetical protein
MTRKTMYLDSMGFGLVAVKPIDYDPRDNMLTCRVTSRTSAGHYGQGYRTGQTVHLPPRHLVYKTARRRVSTVPESDWFTPLERKENAGDA